MNNPDLGLSVSYREAVFLVLENIPTGYNVGVRNPLWPGCLWSLLNMCIGVIILLAAVFFHRVGCQRSDTYYPFFIFLRYFPGQVYIYMFFHELFVNWFISCRWFNCLFVIWTSLCITNVDCLSLMRCVGTFFCQFSCAGFMFAGFAGVTIDACSLADYPSPLTN